MKDKKIIRSRFFINNRAKLLEKCPAPIVISANALIQRTRDDDAFPFEQDGNFWYLTGIDEPDLILVIDGAEEYLILPHRSARHKVFSEQIDKRKLKDISGINKIHDYLEGWEKLTVKLKKSKQFSAPKPPEVYLTDYDIFTNPAARVLVDRILSINPDLKQQDINKEIIGQRMIKTKDEVASIRRAIEMTSKILVKISANIENYQNEHDIAADLNDFYFRHKLDYAFMPIIAAGKNACILHYNSNNDPIKKQDAVLIDTGVKFNNYCSDITRTLIKNPSSRQNAVYKAVVDTQTYAMSLLKPGVLMKEYETKVAKFIGNELKSLGLIKEVTSEKIGNMQLIVQPAGQQNH